MTTIENALEAAKISRYYLTSYTSAERSNVLDGRLWATIEEQKRYFARHIAEAKQSLHGNLSALRVLCTEALRATKDAADRAAIEAQIEALDKEMAKRLTQ